MNDHPDLRQVITEAAQAGIAPHLYALQNGYSSMLGYGAIWPEPEELPDQSEAISDDREPIYRPGKSPDAVELMTDEVCRCIQFPEDTAYMFGLGVVASVLTLNSTYQYYDSKKPVTLYVCSAQPPSTGKSGVKDFFMNPIDRNFIDINTKNATARQSILIDIADREALIKKAEGSERDAHLERLVALQEELAQTPIYKWSPTDPTPEGLTEMSLGQTGYMAINSDEAESLNTLLGAVYGGDSGGKKNYGIVLKAWDGEYIDTVRITRDAGSGYVRGTINVIAQDDTIETLLHAGASGRGVSERFFIVREPTLKGRRTHGLSTTVSAETKQRYAALVDAIFSAGELVFTFDDEANQLIIDRMNDLEPKIGPDGEWGHDMISGFFGKFDKHVRKLSCVLQAVRAFDQGGDRSTTVGAWAVRKAIRIFYAAGATYVQAADSMDHAGVSTEFGCIVDALRRFAGKKQPVIELRKLRDAIKNHHAMKGVGELTKQIKNNYLPVLQDNNYLLVSGNKILVNPRLQA